MNFSHAPGRYLFNLEKRRWFAAELRPPAGAKKDAAAGGEASSSQQAGEGSAQGEGSASTSQQQFQSGIADIVATGEMDIDLCTCSIWHVQGPASLGRARLVPSCLSQVRSMPFSLFLLRGPIYVFAGKEKNSALYRAAVKIQAQFRGYMVGLSEIAGWGSALVWLSGAMMVHLKQTQGVPRNLLLTCHTHLCAVCRCARHTSSTG